MPENIGPLLITGGLALDAAGAVLLASVLMISKQAAHDRTASRWASDDDDPKRFETPAVKGLMRDRRRALLGGGLLATGFALQIAGAWL